VLDRPPLFPAGEGYNYTDAGYLVAGLILEKAMGRSYYEMLRERFIEPLQLLHTVPSDQRDIPELVAGRQERVWYLPGRVVDAHGSLRWNPAVEWTGGGLATNPQDLVLWAKALYEERAFPGPYLDELLDSPSNAGENNGYGLGVYIYRNTPLGTAYGHGGYWPGYRTGMAYFPDHRVAVAVQLNADESGDPREYILSIAAAVVRALDAERSQRTRRRRADRLSTRKGS
jgi:D-alanyl-D-alanine carboxypeptidase